jgi:hypothetical protein
MLNLKSVKSRFNCDELEIDRNVRDFHRCINKFMKDYRVRTRLIKDEKRNLLADSNNILHG